MSKEAKPEWDWRWYALELGVDRYKLALVWIDKPAETVTLGEETFMLGPPSS